MRWLLIRGLSRDARHWGSFPQTFAEELGVEVKTIDPPGFGTQIARTSPSTIAEITDDIRDRANIGGDDWSILGISLGGMVTLDWIARYPNDFQRAWPRGGATVPDYWAGVSPALQPERCWLLAVGVVWWTGMPRRRCGRGGEPGLTAPSCGARRLVRSGRWSARTHPLLGAGSCRPTPDRLAESTSPIAAAAP